MFRFALIVLVAVTAWCYWPVMSGSFVIDDYVFLAQSRIVDAPLVAFWSNHFYEPVYFRPIGVVIWWIATRLFELDYAAHSAINLALHALNVALLAYFIRLITERTSAALAAAAVFALLPFSFAATLWPSNRFDLLATFFLLLAAIASSRYLRSGKPLSWLAAGAAALAACWSKELAFPIATMLAFVCLIAGTHAHWQRRVAIFALLGFAISVAFFLRHSILPLPYAVTGPDVFGSLAKGATTWLQSARRIFADATTGDGMANGVFAVLIVAATFALVTALLVPKRKAQRETRVSVAMIVCALAVFASSAMPQWPTASGFAFMLDGSAFGSVTFARFYYAPTAAAAIVLSLLLAQARLARSLSTVIALAAMTIGLQTRGLATQFATWTQTEIRPVAMAATALADRVASETNQACTLVLLGTQSNHPWFRMFSDVTVKALTDTPEVTSRCQVLTESTPWIFLSPANRPLADIGLEPIAIDAKGTLKPDYLWGGVRYRYRTMVDDTARLTNARFFDWNGTTFVEVTETVKSGARQVKTHGWGF